MSSSSDFEEESPQGKRKRDAGLRREASALACDELAAQTAGRRQRRRVTYKDPDTDEDFSAEEEDVRAPPPQRRGAARGAAATEPSPSSDDNDGSDSDVDDERGASADEGSSDDESDSGHEYYCRVCDDGGELLCCEEAGCSAAYHLKCLSPPLTEVPDGKWSCPGCVSPIDEVERILDVRTLPGEQRTTSPRPPRQEFHVKFKDRSYRACAWVTLPDLKAAGRRFPGVLTRLRNFQARGRERVSGGDDSVSDIEDEGAGMVHGVRPEWTVVDRVIASRRAGRGRAAGGAAEAREYLCKWKELGYEECTWEAADTLQEYAAELQRFHERGPIDPVAEDGAPSRAASAGRGKQKAQKQAAAAPPAPSRPFVRITATPEYLAGGALHPYQVEGVNWLLNAHNARNHVILADEMGLGKTVQAISHLATLHARARDEGAPILPHLIVAPLSTLRNWEREFASWAPHLNVLMMIGPQLGRQVIREHELFAAGKRGRDGGRAVQFHAMITSYEIAIAEGSLLQSLSWDVLCVDEGHRLRTRESRLFQALSAVQARQRVLLTGTPLQNRIEELFALLTYLDPAKFPDADAFQARFAALDSEAHLRELHALLAPHLLRRVKKDVLRDLPPKRELIVRVGLSPLQRELYKAVLTKNLPVLRALSGRGAPPPKLMNVMMDLRQICCHPYLKGAEPEEVLTGAAEHARLTEASGKLVLLARLLPALRARGHRVLIYSQFTRMLDVLEDWLRPLQLQYERIDGGVSGTQRQARIDRFNAPGSPVFAFLLSTRAGGIGINLATADTVIIFDSDWNPHADAQAAARAHRMGQARDVLIYRLVTRASVEERMISAAKRKMILDHLVVQKMPSAAEAAAEDAAGGASKPQKAGGLRQAQLDDILRYGATELFAEDGGADGAAAPVTWDDAAVEQLLDRTAGGESRDAAEDEQPEDELLAAFKVAHFEVQPAEEGAKGGGSAAPSAAAPMEEDGAAAPAFWDALLGERYAESMAVEDAAMGKGKRMRKVVSYAADGNDSSGSGGDDYDATDDEVSDDDGGGSPTTGRDRGLLPLYDAAAGTVHGFTARDRAAFHKAVMRYGVGDASWRPHQAVLRDKSSDAVREYGALYLAHLAEPPSQSDVFSDGVPKEGLRVSEALQRIASMHLFSRKLADCAAARAMHFDTTLPGAPRPTVPTRAWGPAHDFRLVSGVVKHGFTTSWREVALDEALQLQPVLRQELEQPAVGQPRAPPAYVASVQQTLPAALQAAGAGPSDPAAAAPGADAAAAHEEAAAAAAAAWRASLVQGLTPTELTAQTNWLKKRVDYLRDAIHATYFYPEGDRSLAVAPSAAARAPSAPALPRLTHLVMLPAQLDRGSMPFTVAEQFGVLCAAAEGTRGDARLAYGAGAGCDSATRARYADGIAALAAQCRQILPLLQQPPASAAAAGGAAANEDEAIVLD